MIIKDFNNQELSYLHTNGLGSFVSSSINGLNTRKEHSSYMVTLGNPSNRLNVIGSFYEKLFVNGKEYHISSKDFLLYKQRNSYLDTFSVDNYPVFTYSVAGITLIKRFCYKHETNNIYFEYRIINNKNASIGLEVIPYYKFSLKGTLDCVDVTYSNHFFTFDDNTISMNTNLTICDSDSIVEKIYYQMDERDGREFSDAEFVYHFLKASVPYTQKESTFYIEYALNSNTFEEYNYFEECDNRINSLLEKTDIKGDFAKRLYVSSLEYLAKRDGLTTIIAGYPFFADWGRDTFISMVGTLIYTKHFSQAREVFDSFVTHLKDGLMPNLFPENGNEAMYNTVDASLLFFESLYLYYKESGDKEYIKGLLPVLDSILDSYIRGTHYNIHMDSDYLLIAGTEKYQLTWMDVRFEDILPTARHGKPVEINALWYNAFCVYNYFNKESKYFDYPEKIKESFNNKFFNGSYLRDFLGEKTDSTEQIRSNMSLALSYSFKVVEKDIAKKCFDVIKEELLTSHGLRSLSYKDVEFKPVCRGDHKSRDLSYHQGTVWPWTTGSFYLAYLEYNNYSSESLLYVVNEMKKYKKLISTACINHIAEIYDGLNPDVARGCFAQSWSVSEVLRVLIILERNGYIL